MMHYSKNVANNLGTDRSRDKGWCQWNWDFLMDKMLSKYIGIMGFSHSAVSYKIGLKSSVMDVGNWAISSMNAQGNSQADPMLMV